MARNPYTLVFGKTPVQEIARLVQTQEVCETFLDDAPSQQVYMITGVRGSGKTVFMNEIARRISSEKKWVVVELNPAKDLLLSLAAKLYNENSLTSIFKKAKINLSYFGIGIEIDRAEPVTDIEVALTRMLEQLQKQGKRVLVAIDEVTSNTEMRVFASAFQIFIRKDLPLFLLMTGLYENIDALQNVDILTFLHRAPKIWLKPLQQISIASQYQKTFHLNDADAKNMAIITRGYPFAFQVLGYYTYENGGDYHAALPDTKQYLAEYVYDKIWSELSRTDRQVLSATTSVKDGKVSEIRSILKMESNEFSPYRDRLIKRGIISGDERGYVRFMLPFFEEYVDSHSA